MVFMCFISIFYDKNISFSGHFRNLNRRYLYLPYISLYKVYVRGLCMIQYLQFRYLKWPLNHDLVAKRALYPRVD